MFRNVLLKTAIVMTGVFILHAWASDATAQVRIKDLCEVKGQEKVMLRGVGLVVGLNGTGDPNLGATLRALGRSLSGSGLEVPKDASGQELTDEYSEAMNVALVFVTAEVPGTGARQGSQTICRVDSFGTASSLEGGHLLHASLTAGPYSGDSGNMIVLATAQGDIRLADIENPVSGYINNGCQFQYDFKNNFTYRAAPRRRSDDEAFNPFGSEEPDGMGSRDGQYENTQMYFDLVIKAEHADFGTASEIADTLRKYQEFGIADLVPSALDPVTVQVPILSQYAEDPVDFIHQILELEVLTKPKSNTVVINRRKGTVIIGDEVRFDPVVVASGDFSVEAGPVRPLDLDSITPIQTGVNYELKRLQQSLAALQAPPETLIDIIEGLEKGGKLYGRIVYAD